MAAVAEAVVAAAVAAPVMVVVVAVVATVAAAVVAAETVDVAAATVTVTATAATYIAAVEAVVGVCYYHSECHESFTSARAVVAAAARVQAYGRNDCDHCGDYRGVHFGCKGGRRRYRGRFSG